MNNNFLITDKEIKEEFLTTKQEKEKPLYLTVKELLDFIYKNNIDFNSPVLVERIQDVYFEKHGWKTKKKKNYEGEEFPDSQFYEIFSPIKYNRAFLNE